MTAVPDGSNVYDERGTVLYRVVSWQDHMAETHPSLSIAASAASASAAAAATVTTNGTSTRKGVSFLPTGSTTLRQAQQPQQALPARLAPLGSSTLAAATTPAAPLSSIYAATTAASPGGATTTSAAGEDATLAALLMLDQLFPPTRLDDEGCELSDREGAEDDEAAPPPATVAGAAAGGDSNALTRSKTGEKREEDGGVAGTGSSPRWLKVAAHNHTSRLDVILLAQHLERRCVEEHARRRGTLCPIRERIFADGLREITRQVTILCPERGQLLQELCDSADQTTGTYDVLFDSACQYAVRKSTERDLKAYLFANKRELESEVRRCENRVHELSAKYGGMKKRFEERKAATAKVHEAEINYVKGSNQQIVSEIKRIMSASETTTAGSTAAHFAKSMDSATVHPACPSPDTDFPIGDLADQGPTSLASSHPSTGNTLTAHTRQDGSFSSKTLLRTALPVHSSVRLEQHPAVRPPSAERGRGSRTASLNSVNWVFTHQLRQRQQKRTQSAGDNGSGSFPYPTTTTATTDKGSANGDTAREGEHAAPAHMQPDVSPTHDKGSPYPIGSSLSFSSSNQRGYADFPLTTTATTAGSPKDLVNAPQQQQRPPSSLSDNEVRPESAAARALLHDAIFGARPQSASFTASSTPSTTSGSGEGAAGAVLAAMAIAAVDPTTTHQRSPGGGEEDKVRPILSQSSRPPLPSTGRMDTATAAGAPGSGSANDAFTRRSGNSNSNTSPTATAAYAAPKEREVRCEPGEEAEVLAMEVLYPRSRQRTRRHHSQTPRTTTAITSPRSAEIGEDGEAVVDVPLCIVAVDESECAVAATTTTTTTATTAFHACKQRNRGVLVGQQSQGSRQLLAGEGVPPESVGVVKDTAETIGARSGETAEEEEDGELLLRTLQADLERVAHSDSRGGHLDSLESSGRREQSPPQQQAHLLLGSSGGGSSSSYGRPPSVPRQRHPPTPTTATMDPSSSPLLSPRSWLALQPSQQKEVPWDAVSGGRTPVKLIFSHPTPLETSRRVERAGKEAHEAFLAAAKVSQQQPQGSVKAAEAEEEEEEKEEKVPTPLLSLSTVASVDLNAAIPAANEEEERGGEGEALSALLPSAGGETLPGDTRPSLCLDTACGEEVADHLPHHCRASVSVGKAESVVLPSMASEEDLAPHTTTTVTMRMQEEAMAQTSPPGSPRPIMLDMAHEALLGEKVSGNSSSSNSAVVLSRSAELHEDSPRVAVQHQRVKAASFTLGDDNENASASSNSNAASLTNVGLQERESESLHTIHAQVETCAPPTAVPTSSTTEVRRCLSAILGNDTDSTCGECLLLSYKVTEGTEASFREDDDGGEGGGNSAMAHVPPIFATIARVNSAHLSSSLAPSRDGWGELPVAHAMAGMEVTFHTQHSIVLSPKNASARFSVKENALATAGVVLCRQNSFPMSSAAASVREQQPLSVSLQAEDDDERSTSEEIALPAVVKRATRASVPLAEGEDDNQHHGEKVANLQEDSASPLRQDSAIPREAIYEARASVDLAAPAPVDDDKFIREGGEEVMPTEQQADSSFVLGVRLDEWQPPHTSTDAATDWDGVERSLRPLHPLHEEEWEVEVEEEEEAPVLSAEGRESEVLEWRPCADRQEEETASPHAHPAPPPPGLDEESATAKVAADGEVDSLSSPAEIEREKPQERRNDDAGEALPPSLSSTASCLPIAQTRPAAPLPATPPTLTTSTLTTTGRPRRRRWIYSSEVTDIHPRELTHAPLLAIEAAAAPATASQSPRKPAGKRHETVRKVKLCLLYHGERSPPKEGKDGLIAATTAPSSKEAHHPPEPSDGTIAAVKTTVVTLKVTVVKTTTATPAVVERAAEGGDEERKRSGQQQHSAAQDPAETEREVQRQMRDEAVEEEAVERRWPHPPLDDDLAPVAPAFPPAPRREQPRTSQQFMDARSMGHAVSADHVVEEDRRMNSAAVMGPKEWLQQRRSQTATARRIAAAPPSSSSSSAARRPFSAGIATWDSGMMDSIVVEPTLTTLSPRQTWQLSRDAFDSAFLVPARKAGASVSAAAQRKERPQSSGSTNGDATRPSAADAKW